MTYDELFRLQSNHRRPSRDIEHGLQVACVNTFRLRHPELSSVLFAVPNGGRRDKVTGARLKDEGALAGVADMILLHRTATYGALCLEIKSQKGRQSESQRRWQVEVEGHGQRYMVVRSVDEFMAAVDEYLKT